MGSELEENFKGSEMCSFEALFKVNVGNNFIGSSRQPLQQYVVQSQILRTVSESSSKRKGTLKIDGSKLMDIKEGSKFEFFKWRPSIKNQMLLSLSPTPPFAFQ